MKINTIIGLSALFMASSVTAALTDGRVDTCTMPGVVAWTFDDGPDVYNDELLAILAEKNVKVTFYMLGEMMDKGPERAASLKKILAAGHQLASHSYQHVSLDAMVDPKKMQDQMIRTSDLMFNLAGVRPAYMRAPEGRCAATCIKAMQELGLVISHWNVDTNDWRHTSEPVDTAVANSMKEPLDLIVNKGDPTKDSFILLQHEIHAFSVRNLARPLMNAILNKGYRFVTMEECIGKPAYLAGSNVPSTSAATTAPAATTTSGAVAPPTGVPTTASTPGVTVSVRPTGANPTPSPNKSGNSTSGAGLVKAGTWAMGLVAVIGYALF